MEGLQDDELQQIRLKKIHQLLQRPKPNRPQTIIEITSGDQFQQLLQDFPDELILLEFYADWCSPCKSFRPIYEFVQNKFREQPIIFSRVNFDRVPQIAQHYQIQSVPSMLFIRKNTVHHRHLGVLMRAQLEDLILGAIRKFHAPVQE
jgi:thioredoxin 1